MANGLYAKFKELILSSGVNLTSLDIKAVLIDTADYTVDLAAHDYLDDVPVAARVATSANLGSKSVTGGVFDAADTSFSAVTGDQSEAVIVYADSGSAATSLLIAYIDEDTSGLPVTPNGGDINLGWDNGANKIFKL